METWTLQPSRDLGQPCENASCFIGIGLRAALDLNLNLNLHSIVNCLEQQAAVVCASTFRESRAPSPDGPMNGVWRLRGMGNERGNAEESESDQRWKRGEARREVKGPRGGISLESSDSINEATGGGGVLDDSRLATLTGPLGGDPTKDPG